MRQTDSSKGEERGGDCLKEGEGTSQRTHMRDPWTWTTVWGLTREGGQSGQRGQRGKPWDNCNSINNKIFFKVLSNKVKSKIKIKIN